MPLLKTQLEKVNVIGMKYVHCFIMDNGTKIEIETTKEDYDQLGGVNPSIPTISGGTLHLSLGRRKVDTPSGNLSPGQYWDHPEDGIVACLDDCREYKKDTLSEMMTKQDDIVAKIKGGLLEVESVYSVPLPLEII